MSVQYIRINTGENQTVDNAVNILKSQGFDVSEATAYDALIETEVSYDHKFQAPQAPDFSHGDRCYF